MPRVYVQFAGMKQLGESWDSIGSKIDDISRDFKETVQNLDWDIKCQENINHTASSLASNLNGYRQALKEYQIFFQQAYDAYVKLDEASFRNEGTSVDSITDWYIDAIAGLTTAVNAQDWANESDQTSSQGVLDFLGYEQNESHPGITGWIGHAGIEKNTDAYSAAVDAYLGYAEAEAKADGGIMTTKKKVKRENGELKTVETMEFLTAEAAIGIGVSAIEVEGNVSTGDDMLGAEVHASGSVLNAEASATGEFSIGQDGINASLKGKAMVSAVEGEAKGTINILGLELTFKAKGYAGAAGVEGKAGIEDNKFVLEGGGAAVLGAGIGIEIGFNEEGWDNFVDFITFWD